MAEAGIDMLFLSAPESMFYVCGYRAEWYQAQSPKAWPASSGIAVHVGSPDIILFDSTDEELMVRCETCAPDIRVFEGDGLREWTDWIVGELKGDGWLDGKIGLEMWSYRPNRVISETFQGALESNGCEVLDATDIVRDLRSIKSEEEMQCIEKASRIADTGLRAAAEIIRPGVTELQVYGQVVSAMCDIGGENPGITMPVISENRSGRSHALASTRMLRKGDVVNIDLCGVFKRYHSNHARTFSVGRPHEDVEKVVRLSARSFDLLSEIIEPNLPADMLLRAMRKYYERAGIYRDRMWFGGYELGIAFPPDWVGQFVYDENLGCTGKRFVPGTVVNYESNFYLPRKAGASLIINTMVFGKKGAKMLGSTQNDLIVS